MPKVIYQKAIHEDDVLYWMYEPKYLLREIKHACERFNRKWKKKPTFITFLTGVIIEYEGDLDVQFSNYVQKNHFKLGAR